MRFWITRWILVCVLIASGVRIAQADDWQPAALTPALGDEIDSTEAVDYHLFPGYEGFVAAQLFTNDNQDHRLDIEYRDANGRVKHRTTGISRAVWNVTFAHVQLVEEFHSLPATADNEADRQYKLALKYAAEAEYDIAQRLMADIPRVYPDAPAAEEAIAHAPVLAELAKVHQALFLPGPLVDQSGRTALLLFSGYYGMWTGVAVPVWLEADGAEPYAAGLLLGAPAGLLTAHFLTKNHEITSGQATMISLGAHLGTWNGLGWTAASSETADGNDVVGMGLLGGLAGIGSAILLTNSVHVSEGHAAATSMALPWGIWFGFVGGVLGDVDDGGQLVEIALVTSDVCVLGTGIAARNVHMSNARARLISLMGVAGGAAGVGTSLLIGGDDLSTEGAFAGMGAGSLLGLVTGAMITKNFDRGKYLASAPIAPGHNTWTSTPVLTMRANPFDKAKWLPYAGLDISF